MDCAYLNKNYKLVTNPTQLNTDLKDVKFIIVEHVYNFWPGHYTEKIKNCDIYEIDKLNLINNSEVEIVFKYQKPEDVIALDINRIEPTVTNINRIEPKVTNITHIEPKVTNITRIHYLTININNITTNPDKPKQYSIYVDQQLEQKFPLFFESENNKVVNNRAATGGKRKSRRGKKRNNRRKKTHRRR